MVMCMFSVFVFVLFVMRCQLFVCCVLCVHVVFVWFRVVCVFVGCVFVFVVMFSEFVFLFGGHVHVFMC